MIANQQGIANAVKAASDPSSSTYGQYLSLSTLQKKYGASSSRRWVSRKPSAGLLEPF